MHSSIIVTCDDCGLSEGINYATLRLHQEHIATVASIMTNFPAAEHAYRLFASYPSLECGVHLNLTDGYSLSKITSPSPLTRADGRFRSRVALFTQALHPSDPFLQLVEAELTAQVEHFLHSGLAARHLTTHMHFHTFPALRVIVFRLALRFNVQWVRAYRLASSVLPFNPLLQVRAARSPDSTSLPFQPDYLMPVAVWLRTGISSATFSRRLKALEGRVEVVVHPSTQTDKTFPQGVRYSPAGRFQEMQYIERVHLE